MMRRYLLLSSDIWTDLEGRAVYVYDVHVRSKSEDTVKEWGNRKFDYVQELLNQVVSRKYELRDSGGNRVNYNFLDEDGVYGFHTEGAIEVLRSSFEWVGWRWSDVIVRLREQYENNFSYKEWRDKVVDKGLLVGDRYIYHPRRVVLEDTTNIARDGLLEIYQNYVEVFIDSLLSAGRRYVEDTTKWIHRPTDGGEPELIGTDSLIYNDTEHGIEYRNTGVAYSNGSIDRVFQWRFKISNNLDPMIDPQARHYLGNRRNWERERLRDLRYSDYNRDGAPGGIGVDDDGDGGADLHDPQVMQADYDGDGVPLVGSNGVLESTLGHPGGDDDRDDVLLCVGDDDEDGVLDENTPADSVLYPVDHWYEYGFGHQPGLYESEEREWAQHGVGRYCPWDWAGIDCRGFVQRCIKIAGDALGLVPDEIVPDLDDDHDYDIKAGHFTRQHLNTLTHDQAGHDNAGNAYVIPTTENNWWKRIRKGDILETGGHVVLVFETPEDTFQSHLKIMHAFGECRDIDRDGHEDFTRKTIITLFSIWRVNINNVTKGRIRLWR